MISLLVAMTAIVLGSLLVSLGFPPETIGPVEWLAPQLGLAWGAAWVGGRAAGSPWRAVLSVGIVVLTVWWAR